MNNSNNIATTAIAKLNEEKASQLIDLAQSKISYIRQEQAKIDKFQKNIAVYQEAIKAMQEDLLVAEVVLGRTPSVSPNPVEVVILNAIAKRNEDKARTQVANSKSHVEGVDACLASIKGCEARITELRKELAALTQDVVTEEQILG